MSTSGSPKSKRKKRKDSIYSPIEDSKVPHKPKPNGQPKRPANAYFLYVKKNRAAIKEANPELSFGQLGKKIAQDWKNNVSAKEKKPYEDEAEKQKQEYQEAMLKYKKSQKYKKYLKDLEEWNEIYKEEYEQQEKKKKEEREIKKKERERKKAQGKDKEKSKKKAKKAKK